MPLFKKKAKNRVCVIGLDGVPFGMVTDLAAKGVMPAMARLIDNGSLRSMKASLPEISSVSWTDFMTGRNSGSHGVFGFTDFRPGEYKTRFPNFSDMRTPTFWDELGRRGKKSIVLNQPATYPARRIEGDGTLVSGFVAIELARSVQPTSLLPFLNKIGYATDIDIPECRRNHGLLGPELTRTTEALEKLVMKLWPEDWSYFEAVITGTDRIHHFLWSAYEDGSHPFHAMFIDYYRRVDRFIAAVSGAFERTTGSLDGLFLLSDHGFTGIVQEVYLNAWLEENGYLMFPEGAPAGLENIAPGTKAFALDPSRIYLNLEGKFPRGTVSPAERGPLAAEIAGKLLGLEYQGRRIIRHVFRAEEIYDAQLAPAGPDLVVVPEPGFDLKGSLKKSGVFGRTDLEGMHTWDNAFFLGPHEIQGDLAIKDLAAIFLERLK